MVGILGRIIIIALWGILFIANLRYIIKEKINADSGVLWAVAIGALQICLAIVNFKWASVLGNPSTWIIEVEQFVFICILYSHEIEVTEMRKKNNELAIQLTLVKAQVKALENEIHAVGKSA